MEQSANQEVFLNDQTLACGPSVAQLVPTTNGGPYAPQHDKKNKKPPPVYEDPEDKGNAINILFKTQMCKHSMQTGRCAKGSSCHFAHTEEELRNKDDSLPVEIQLKMMNIPYNNYKTQVCKHFEQTGQCRFGKNCTYAHGLEELRKPYEDLPVQAIQVQRSNQSQATHNAFKQLNNQMQVPSPAQLPKRSAPLQNDSMMQHLIQQNVMLQSQLQSQQNALLYQQAPNSTINNPSAGHLQQQVGAAATAGNQSHTLHGQQAQMTHNPFAGTTHLLQQQQQIAHLMQQHQIQQQMLQQQQAQLAAGLPAQLYQDQIALQTLINQHQTTQLQNNAHQQQQPLQQPTPQNMMANHSLQQQPFMPMPLQNLSAQMMNQQYPVQPQDMLGANFIQQQLSAPSVMQNNSPQQQAGNTENEIASPLSELNTKVNNSLVADISGQGVSQSLNLQMIQSAPNSQSAQNALATSSNNQSNNGSAGLMYTSLPGQQSAADKVQWL